MSAKSKVCRTAPVAKSAIASSGNARTFQGRRVSVSRVSYATHQETLKTVQRVMEEDAEVFRRLANA